MKSVKEIEADILNVIQNIKAKENGEDHRIKEPDVIKDLYDMFDKKGGK